jgi:small subunit ribosomal protein S17
MKMFTGKIVSIKQQKTAVVEVVWKVAHPLYKKLLNKKKRYQVDTTGFTPQLDDVVTIVETRQIAKNKYFKIKEIKKI